LRPGNSTFSTTTRTTATCDAGPRFRCSPSQPSTHSRAFAHWRGFGKLRGAWLCVGVLVGGITGNGLSHLIWPHGTPDFIEAGDYVWNVADFAIGLGLAGSAFSIAGSALFAYARGRIGTGPGV
jgi:hypothetical protein